MSSIQEKGDLSGDNKLSGKDIDINWAYLQTKLLAETEWSENIQKATETAKCNDNPAKCSPVDALGNVTQAVNKCGDSAKWRLNETYTGSGSFECPPCCQYLPTNFIEKMLDLYEANQTAGIAETNTEFGPNVEDNVADAPGTLELGSPLGKPQIKLLKRWTLDDQPNSSSDNGAVTKAVESFSGELSANLVNTWWRAKTTATDMLQIGSTASVEFDVSGALPNIGYWTLHFQAHTNWGTTGGNKILSKGTMELVAWKKTIVLKELNGAQYYFTFPNEVEKSVYNNKLIDFYFQRNPQGVKLFIDDGTGPKSCPQSVVGIIPYITEDDDSPLIIHGNAVSHLKDVWIADGSLTATKITTLSQNRLDVYKTKNDLNIDSAYIAFQDQTTDEYGNWMRLFQNDDGALWPGQRTDLWQTPPAGSANGFSTNGRTHCLKLGADNRYIALENVNFKGNFTIGAWIRTGATNSQIIKFENIDGTKTFGVEVHTEKAKLVTRGKGLSNNWPGPIAKDLSTLGSQWFHIVIVKNRNTIGFWINGATDDDMHVTLPDSDIDALGNTRLRFYGSTSNPVYLADIRVFDYALSHVPANGYGPRSSWPFIDDIKA
jgi:hypothetical protein